MYDIRIINGILDVHEDIDNIWLQERANDLRCFTRIPMTPKTAILFGGSSRLLKLPCAC